MKKLIPTGERILVEPIRDDTSTVRGLFIPEAHRESQPSIDCLVMAKGSRVKLDVNIGDRVVVNRFCGIDVKMADKTFKLVSPNDLLAIIE